MLKRMRDMDMVQEAYRKWVCSSLVPYFAHGEPQDLESSEGTWTRIRPCLSLCQSVEQRCPYLLPGDRAPAYPTQYAGEPTFLCRDPNILETGEQATRALHSSDERECCFHVCSEQELELGICANCTDREPRKRGREHDPPTAPHCEITPIQSDSADEDEAAGWPVFTDAQDIEFGSTSTFFPMVMHDQQQHQQQQQQYQGTSLCGSGGVGSMTSSSSNRATASHVVHFLCLLSIMIQFFRWSCLLLGSFSRTIVVLVRKVLHSERGFASFVVVVVVGSERIKEEEEEEEEEVEEEKGGGGGGGGGREGREMRSIEEIRPRSRSGWFCFRWWCPSLSSMNRKLTISLNKKDNKNEEEKEKEDEDEDEDDDDDDDNDDDDDADDNDYNKDNEDDEDDDDDDNADDDDAKEKEEEEDKKKKKEDWHKVWWRQWCCWWSFWCRKRRNNERITKGRRRNANRVVGLAIDGVVTSSNHVVAVVGGDGKKRTLTRVLFRGKSLRGAYVFSFLPFPLSPPSRLRPTNERTLEGREIVHDPTTIYPFLHSPIPFPPPCVRKRPKDEAGPCSR
ncbi:hypothetical protein V1478_003894 [Vespula squamosa]|uniref:Uncharacterized protein n=1 Tax=Vespula squamosa TaxID=30214 RepID=A0ABD2BN55_VESSQ